MAEKVTIILPMLPTSLSAEGKAQRRRQQAEEKEWQDYIASEWALLGKPQFDVIRVTMRFLFPAEITGDPAVCLSTGSKLVGEAMKGLLIPDLGPEHLTAWNFCFERGAAAQTAVVIEEERRKRNCWQRPACNHYEECTAPMCPLDQTSLKGIWYPDEEICRSKINGNIPWAKMQRKIAKSTGRGSGYFTLAMLNRSCIIRPGISGLDPDREGDSQVRKWMAEHPEKREMSAEEILMRKKLAQKCLNLEDDRNASEGVAAPFLKPPLNRVLGQKKCP